MFKNCAKNILNANRKEVLEWISTFDAVLTDCDGVLWHDNSPIAGSPETINTLSALGKRVYFVTNNSTKTRHDIWQRAASMKYNVKESDIIAPTYSVAEYLKQRNFKGKVYVIGGGGLTDELDALGISHFGSGPEPLGKLGTFLDEQLPQQSPAEVGAVIVGFDEHFNFAKLIKATHYISSNPDCLLLTTNTDTVHKYPKYHIPGTGALVQAVETSTGKEAISLGKPSPVVCESLIHAGILVPERTLMIGDSAKIDVVFGKNCGFQTMLVDNSNHPETELTALLANPQENTYCMPDIYLPRLSDLLPFLS